MKRCFNFSNISFYLSSPSEVIVFNNTNHSGNRGQNAQSLPEVPQYEEIQRFLKDSKLVLFDICNPYMHIVRQVICGLDRFCIID